MSRRSIVLAALCLLPGAAASAFDEGRADFAVRVRDLVVPYQVFAVSVMPGETLGLSVDRATRGAASFECRVSTGRAVPAGPARWTWKAPAKPGLHTITIRRVLDGETISLNVFVMRPRAEVRNGVLRGYRIGRYPEKPLRGLAIYRPPNGFIEVTPQNADTRISPHFTLRQFLCKQEGDWPKYALVRGQLLLLLEWLLKEVNAHGWQADTFHVMSGFRTPWYNAAIRNVQYSRHQWGGAADIFIDQNPRDGVMDDLNGDGTIDKQDADVLYDLIEDLRGREENGAYEGGLGDYGATEAHGPFVHVDARGFRARWGR